MKAPPAMAVAVALLFAPPVRDGRLATRDRCATEQADQALGPSRSLYCIDLIPVPDFRGASGTVALLRAARSPFIVAVDADGHHEYELEITLRNLPDETIVYPGHNYADRPTSTIGHEKRRNMFMRFQSVDEFLRSMGR